MYRDLTDTDAAQKLSTPKSSFERGGVQKDIIPGPSILMSLFVK